MTLLTVAFNRHNKPVPKYLLAYYDQLDEYEFMDLFQYYWITGKWPLKEYDNIGKFVELLKSFKTDTYNITKTYFNLLNECTSEYLETCTFTFLNKVMKLKGNKVKRESKWYALMLLDYAQFKKPYIKPAIDNYLRSEIENPDLKIYNLIINLNKAKR